MKNIEDAGAVHFSLSVHASSLLNRADRPAKPHERWRGGRNILTPTVSTRQLHVKLTVPPVPELDTGARAWDRVEGLEAAVLVQIEPEHVAFANG